MKTQIIPFDSYKSNVFSDESNFIIELFKKLQRIKKYSYLFKDISKIEISLPYTAERPVMTPFDIIWKPYVNVVITFSGIFGEDKQSIVFEPSLLPNIFKENKIFKKEYVEKLVNILGKVQKKIQNKEEI